MTEADKVYQEARGKVAQELAVMYGEAPWMNLSDYTKCNYEILADQFLNLKGEGWELIILPKNKVVVDRPKPKHMPRMRLFPPRYK